MDHVTIREDSISPSMDPKPLLSSRRKDNPPRKCERREKLHQKKPSSYPTIHPDVEHAQKGEDKRVFRLCEDSRPMFSPVPGNVSDVEAEDSPKVAVSNKRPREKVTFPSIHVERCEKGRPSYSPSPSTSPQQLSPRHPSHTDREGHQQERSRSPGSLNVPSPYLPCRSEGRMLLMTHSSSRGLLGSWSRSEGNLPEAVSRSDSSPGSQSHLLDITYRPSWQSNPTPRPSSDVSLHELRRQQAPQSRRPGTPTRLPVRLEPLNASLASNHRALSATNLQYPSP